MKTALNRATGPADNKNMRAVLFAWILALQMTGAAALPRPDGYVNDFARILDESVESDLEHYLTTLERDTSAEVAIATIDSLDGLTVEQYANRLFEEWGIGKRQKDNGVLMLIAPNEREVRIEVGYGLEGTLPDGLAGDIIRNEIIPAFKANDFPRGVGRGVERIARILRRDPNASMLTATDESDAGDGAPPLWFIVPFLGAFIFVGAFACGLGLGTKTFGPLIFGGMFGGVPVIMLAVVRSPLAFGILGTVGAWALGLGLRRGRSAYWRDTLRRKTAPFSDRDPMVWEMGATSSSSSGRGSSDGGGTSSSSSSDFGGGSSGGGGASGRW